MVLLSDFPKDPIHDFNRFVYWNSCDSQFWPDIMYILGYKPEKVHVSDYKSLEMNHASFALDSATTTPSSGKKEKNLDDRI